MKEVKIDFVMVKQLEPGREEERPNTFFCEMEDDIADDIFQRQRDSRYVKAGRSKVSVTRLVRTMAYLSGYDRAEFVGAFEVTAAQDCEP
jgi:hypothetical protein